MRQRTILLLGKKDKETRGSLAHIAHTFFNKVKEQCSNLPKWPALETKYKVEKKDVETPQEDVEAPMDLNSTTIKDSVLIAKGYKEGALVHLDQKKNKYEVDDTVFKITGFDDKHVLLKDASSTGPTDHRR